MQKELIDEQIEYLFKDKLTESSYNLLTLLIKDYCSKIPKGKDKVYLRVNNAALIYNLFNGNYKFSYNQYKEIYNVLKSM